MKYNYVAIEREYGSGGTEIGQRLGMLSQIPCYGIEILKKVSENLGIDMPQIEHYEETVTNSFLYAIYLLGKVGDDTGNYLSREGQVYLEEKRVIQSFASQGPAVFVGRCASDSLADKNGVLKVFIRADKELRKRER